MSTQPDKMRTIPLPSTDELRRWFEYHPATGDLRWRWRADRLANWNARYAGVSAGTLDSKGYLRVKMGRSHFAVHRLVWKWAYGGEPLLLDHIDGVRTNNRLDNLRPATSSQNRMNERPGRGAHPKGTYRHRTGKFVAQIKKDGQHRYLGLHDTAEQAHAAYAAASAELFGAFRRLG